MTTLLGVGVCVRVSVWVGGGGMQGGGGGAGGGGLSDEAQFGHAFAHGRWRILASVM